MLPITGSGTRLAELPAVSKDPPGAANFIGTGVSRESTQDKSVPYPVLSELSGKTYGSGLISLASKHLQLKGC